MFDIYDDRGALLKHYYPNLNDLPDFVSAGIKGNWSDSQKLASEDFAVAIPVHDGIRHAYPINNDGMTAVSCLYFDHTYQNLPPELQKQAAYSLKAACDVFGIECPEKVAELSTEYQEQKESASGAKKPFQSQGIAGSQMFPLATPEQVEKAASLHDQLIRKMHPEQRREFSQSLLEKSAEFGVDLPESVSRWGGDQISDVYLREAIEKRAGYLDEDKRQMLIQAVGSLVGEPAEKVAEFLYKVDTGYGLDVLWDSHIPDPQSIYQYTATVPMAKFAGIEMPMESWHDACDKGVLDVLSPELQMELRRDPSLLDSYDGHPVFEHVVDGLESLGMVERIDG